MLTYEEGIGLTTATSVTRNLGIRNTKLWAQLFRGGGCFGSKNVNKTKQKPREICKKKRTPMKNTKMNYAHLSDK